MKKAEINFRIIGNSGPVSIYWYDGPYGDAVEAIGGNGVGWFSPLQDLLGVEFDDVNSDNDQQELSFTNGVSVKIEVKDKKVKILEVVDPRAKEAV